MVCSKSIPKIEVDIDTGLTQETETKTKTKTKTKQLKNQEPSLAHTETRKIRKNEDHI